ncbi:MAG TPA: DUF1150 family protein [Paracoccaceae bacterium]|nr:DUF1150 family protein [Paracoccaceae bacterium]
MTDFPSINDTKFNQTASGQPIVYVRPVRTNELPAEVKEQIEANLGKQTVYAIHAPSGEVLALVPDRRQAFWIARQNQYAPVSVH